MGFPRGNYGVGGLVRMLCLQESVVLYLQSRKGFGLATQRRQRLRRLVMLNIPATPFSVYGCRNCIRFSRLIIYVNYGVYVNNKNADDS